MEESSRKSLARMLMSLSVLFNIVSIFFVLYVGANYFAIRVHRHNASEARYEVSRRIAITSMQECVEHKQSLEELRSALSSKLADSHFGQFYSIKHLNQSEENIIAVFDRVDSQNENMHVWLDDLISVIYLRSSEEFVTTYR